MSCRICNAQTVFELCPTCTRKLGLSRGDSARPALPCARCGHAQVIRALVRELTATGGDVAREVVTPMGDTYEPALDRAFFSDKVKGSAGVEQKRPLGLLEMHVCRKCGFTEWYCRDPLKVPIGPEYGTELVDASDTGSGEPYR